MRAVSDDWGRAGRRWVKFNLVGAIGIFVQLATLSVLKSALHFEIMLATGLAVETAVIHNYLWHERFTWVDRVGISRRESLKRFLRFNVTTGLFSIVGNMVLMKVLADIAHMNYLVANLMTIATCSVVNFLVSDRVVFNG
jgi:putative flippase GtrA